MEAVAAILDSLKEGGRALVYVWALEQKGSRRGWDKGDEQDVLVPWVSKGQKGKEARHGMSNDNPNSGHWSGKEDKVYQRYYHLYREGELEKDIVTAGGIILEAGYEKDNWWAIATSTVERRTAESPHAVEAQQ